MQDASAFYAKDIVTIIALFLGPLAAVFLTLWSQRRNKEWASKNQLFMNLMAYRKSAPPNIFWVNALNMIDVVYAKHPTVVSKWHELYEVLNQKPMNMERYNHTYLEMLSEMATILGYKTLKQTDIDKFYSPQAHGDQAQLLQDILAQFLRVLRNFQAQSSEHREIEL